MKVGFIGLGTMGSHMALNVRKGGHDVVVHDLREAAAGPHLAAGCTWASSAREVAEKSDVVFTSLPGPKDVQLVADELLPAMRKGSAWFDLSTNSPTVVRKISERFAAKGVVHGSSALISRAASVAATMPRSMARARSSGSAV